MLNAATELNGFHLQARDGEVGKVAGLLFDDLHWTVRYLIVDTGNWLKDRKVLISPQSLGTPDADAKSVPVDLTIEQVEGAPPLSTEKPVSRQHEAELVTHYGWTPYWPYDTPPTSPELMEARSNDPARRAEYEMEPEPKAESESTDRDRNRPHAPDPHLRDSRVVIGYQIQASDGEIGHVDDLLVDITTWVIRYLVVDTRNWLPGRKVLIAPGWVRQIDWEESAVQTDHSRQEIKDSPEFDPSQPVSRKYEERLHHYYERPTYW